MFEYIRTIQSVVIVVLSHTFLCVCARACVRAVNFAAVYRDTRQIIIALNLKKNVSTVNKVIRNRSKHRN